MNHDLVHRPRWMSHADPRFRPGDMPPLYGDTASTLIVDDDEEMAEILMRLLGGEGYHCTVVHSATEARHALEEREFAVALVDVMMPDESGLVLVTDMLAHHPHLAVVMVTGVDDTEVAKLATDSGVYGYVIKPFTPSQVLITVANAGMRRCVQMQRDSYESRLEDRARGDEASRIEKLEEHIATATHDINGLLGIIVNSALFMTERMERSAGSIEIPDREALEADANRIVRAVEKAAHVVKDLRAASRP